MHYSALRIPKERWLAYENNAAAHEGLARRGRRSPNTEVFESRPNIASLVLRAIEQPKLSNNHPGTVKRASRPSKSRSSNTY